jgi:hypothetical protein
VFYVHSWEELHTGIFTTHVNNIGCTEYQVIAGFYIITTLLFGNDFPDTFKFGYAHKDILGFVILLM